MLIEHGDKRTKAFPMTTYGYTRVSTNLQADEGLSLAVQERQLKGWCMIDGSELAEIIVDAGVSGSKPLFKRPEASRLVKLLKPGDTLVSTKLDRLFRSASDALNTVERMKARNIRIVAIDLGEITGNGLAKVILTISAAFAEYERDQIRERVSAVKADQRARQRYLGGIVPYGFTVASGDLVEHPEQQAVIAYARSLRASGTSLRKIRGILIEHHGTTLSLNAIARCTGLVE